MEEGGGGDSEKKEGIKIFGCLYLPAKQYYNY